MPLPYDDYWQFSYFCSLDPYPLVYFSESFPNKKTLLLYCANVLLY